MSACVSVCLSMGVCVCLCRAVPDKDGQGCRMGRLPLLSVCRVPSPMPGLQGIGFLLWQSETVPLGARKPALGPADGPADFSLISLLVTPTPTSLPVACMLPWLCHWDLWATLRSSEGPRSLTALGASGAAPFQACQAPGCVSMSDPPPWALPSDTAQAPQLLLQPVLPVPCVGAHSCCLEWRV